MAGQLDTQQLFGMRTRAFLFLFFGFQVALGFLGGGLILTTAVEWQNTGRIVLMLPPSWSLIIAVPGFVAGGFFFACLDLLARLSRKMFAAAALAIGFAGSSAWLLGVAALMHGGHFADFVKSPFYVYQGFAYSTLAHPATIVRMALCPGLVSWFASPIVALIIYPHAVRGARGLLAKQAAWGSK